MGGRPNRRKKICFQTKTDTCGRGLSSWALSIQPKVPEISVGTPNGTDHFRLVRPEYSGPALKMVHFDQSGHFGRWDRNVPFHLTKLLSSAALLYPAYKNNNQTRGGLGRVCPTGMYRSTGHLKFLKFQTEIFVEWKAPHVYACFCFNKTPSFWFVSRHFQQKSVMKVSTNQRTESAEEKAEFSNGNMSTTFKYSPTVSTCIPGSQRRKQI